MQLSVSMPSNTFEHCIYLIEHDHLALEMVVVVVEPTPLCDRPTLGYYLFAPGKRHADRARERAAERGVVVEGDSCGGGEKRRVPVVNLKQAQCRAQ